MKTEQISPQVSTDGKYIQLQLSVGLSHSTRNKMWHLSSLISIHKKHFGTDISTEAIKPHPKWSKQNFKILVLQKSV